MNKILKKQKGAIILLFLILLPLMMAFVGLAIDIGYIYTVKTKLQNTADAAALAGVVHMHSSESPSVTDYVQAMLKANSFEPLGAGYADNLSADTNWKLTFEKTDTNELTGQKEIVALTNSTEATRLRVSILQKVKLVFLPVVLPALSEIELTATAVAQGSSGMPLPMDFQIMTLGTLRLGSYMDATNTKPLSGDVHIPSYPTDYKVPDLYAYNDFGEYLNRHILAHKLDLKDKSSLRLSGKLISQNVDSTYIYKNQLFISDINNYLPEANATEKYNIHNLTNFMNGVFYEGINLYNAAKSGRIQALWIDLKTYSATSTEHTLNDYNIKSIRDKNPSYFDTLDVVVPVIVYRSDNKPFNLSTNISFFSFTQPLIVINGNLEITGSKQPPEADPIFGTSSRTYMTYSNIYCYSFPSPESRVPVFPHSLYNPNAGNLAVGSGSANVKNFSGVMYADSSIRINAAKAYRRHIFRSTLISPNDIIFAADHSSYTCVPSTHRFESSQKRTKISLVE